VKSEDCLLAVEFIYAPPASHWKEEGNYLKTIDVWGKTLIGFWDLDRSLSWCLRSGFNQCCSLLAPVAVFGSGTGQL